MKRSFVFLGLCLALGAGLTIAKEAKSSDKAATEFCCGATTVRCKLVTLPGYSYGPKVTRMENCPEPF